MTLTVFDVEKAVCVLEERLYRSHQELVIRLEETFFGAIDAVEAVVKVVDSPLKITIVTTYVVTTSLSGMQEIYF